MIDRGLSERRALRAARMSASAYRYVPAPDRNVELRQKIEALAHRHKRYGVGMIHLKLRQAGMLVNYKRVERLYQDAKLQVRRRKRKKVPFGDRQPLYRPLVANEVWSMDFVFDRTAEGRSLKCLTIVDDATHEAVAVEVERAFSGTGVARVLDRLALSRGLPQIRAGPIRLNSEPGPISGFSAVRKRRIGHAAGLCTAGRFGRLRRTGNRPAVHNPCGVPRSSLKPLSSAPCRTRPVSFDQGSSAAGVCCRTR